MAQGENDIHKSDRPGLTGLAKQLGKLPADKRRVALEMSAALAGVSLRASRDFVEAVPAAAEVLSVDALRAWGELGRKLAMGSSEVGSKFFIEGVYATVDEAPDDRLDNASYKRVTVDQASFAMTPAGAMAAGRPAIYAWRDHGSCEQQRSGQQRH